MTGLDLPHRELLQSPDNKDEKEKVRVPDPREAVVENEFEGTTQVEDEAEVEVEEGRVAIQGDDEADQVEEETLRATTGFGEETLPNGVRLLSSGEKTPHLKESEQRSLSETFPH